MLHVRNCNEHFPCIRLPASNYFKCIYPNRLNSLIILEQLRVRSQRTALLLPEENISVWHDCKGPQTLQILCLCSSQIKWHLSRIQLFFKQNNLLWKKYFTTEMVACFCPLSSTPTLSWKLKEVS